MADPIMDWQPVGERHVGSCIVCGCRVDPAEVVLEPVNPERPNGKQRRLVPLVRVFATFEEPVLYCVEHVHHGREVKRAPRQKGFALSAEERAAIFRGDHPQIVRAPDDELPELHHNYELSDLVSVTFTHEGRNKRSEVKYRYRVFDQRGDRPRILRRNPPALRPEEARHDRVHPPTAGEIRRAAEDSAYASGGARDTLIEDAGEAPAERHVANFGRAGRLRRALEISEEIEGKGEVP